MILNRRFGYTSLVPNICFVEYGFASDGVIMADGDLFGGVQLDPLTQPPSNLDHSQIDHSVQKVREWFFENFEGPEQSTPRDDGEFVYIWGGPWETRDIIETIFSAEEHPAEVLEAIIEDIEDEGDAWVPSARRIQPPEEYEDEPSRDAANIHGDLLKRIAELERHVAALRDRPAGIGHNNPPEPIGSIEGIDTDLRELEGALETLKAQPAEPPETALPAIEEAERTIDTVGGKWRERLTKLGGDLISGIAKEAGKRLFGEIVDNSWLHWAVIHLQAVGSLVREWIIAVFPPF